jgi:hypothetical protein
MCVIPIEYKIRMLDKNILLQLGYYRYLNPLEKILYNK